MDEDVILQRAHRAYHNRCVQACRIYMQPARSSCRVVRHKGTHYAVLANGCGYPKDTLAVYRVSGNPSGQFRLVGLSVWPPAVTA